MFESNTGLFARRAAAGLLAGVVATAAGATAQDPARSRPARPNIVLIFPDNLGIGEVGAYGGVRAVPTPNIDRVAREGIRLTNLNVGSRGGSAARRRAERPGVGDVNRVPPGFR
jgi:hypothetical protein